MTDKNYSFGNTPTATAVRSSAAALPGQERGSKAGSVIAIILALLQVLAVITPVIDVMAISGPDFGIYDFDDIVFDFLKTLGNSLTDYQRTVKLVRRLVYISQLLLIPCLVFFFVLEKKHSRTAHPIMCICASALGQFGMLAPMFLLALYDFNGFSRTFAFIVFFISAALCIVTGIFLCKKLGIRGIAVILAGTLIAALITVIFVPLVGVCVATFGDLFLFLGIALMLAGPGGSSIFDYVIVI